MTPVLAHLHLAAALAPRPLLAAAGAPFVGGFVVVVLVALVALRSLHVIGASQVGLVAKQFSARKLSEGNPIAFRGEAGYQAKMLMPGVRFKLWPIFRVSKHPWVQVPAGEMGVVIAQIGEPLPTGAKSAAALASGVDFTDLDGFVGTGGQKGIQRPVLGPGTLLPIHPVGFLVITARQVFGLPADPAMARVKQLTPAAFGLAPEQLLVTQVRPQVMTDGAGHQQTVDVIGIVTALDGPPQEANDIASRLGGYDDVQAALTDGSRSDGQVIETVLSSKNHQHNNYQDFQRFLDAGGRIGLQHDPLLYGSYLLNPFLVRVELVPMLVVQQGQVAVVKSYVGLPTIDTSGAEFKFGSIVRPGHRGIWAEPLRTGKYPINPRIYAAEIVPTSILTLNWADNMTAAHQLDAKLSSIVGKSREGFEFKIDLQVQIHVPDTRASRVISMVGTMQNLVNEVLQSAVGNHFRNVLQSLPAIEFIEMRQQIQGSAYAAIAEYLSGYQVETRGVYIQDVVFPPDLVTVLTNREIANQERETFGRQQEAQTARIAVEQARGTADMQSKLAAAQVSVDIERNKADARLEEARGSAEFTRATGQAEADRAKALGFAEADATKALGLARAEGFRAQAGALGQSATALVNVVNAIADGRVKIAPEVLVAGGSSLDGLAGSLMRYLRPTGSPATAVGDAVVAVEGELPPPVASA